MSRSPMLTVLMAVVLLAVVASAGFAAATASTPGDAPEPTTKNHPPSDGANFTVEPDDNSPGTQTAYTMLSKGEGPWGDSQGLRTVDYYKITTQATQFKDCSPDNARAFGIDRDNDEAGTHTDEPLLDHMKSYSVSGRVITVDLYNESDAFGNPTYLNRSDETVARLVGCVVTPEQPGWYQFTGYVNGTNYRGQFQEVQLYSKYFYVCDCENRQEARQQLGPAPYSGDNGSTPTSVTPTPSGSPSPTAGETTATASSPSPNDGGSPTATSTSPSGTGTTTTTPGGETTSGDASPGGTRQTGDTPTGGQPGFGLAVTAVALVGAALLALRRR